MLILENLHFSFNFEDSFGWYSNLYWQLFSFGGWNTSTQALLAFQVSVERSVVTLMDLPFEALCHFTYGFQYSSFVLNFWQFDSAVLRRASFLSEDLNASIMWHPSHSSDLGCFLLLMAVNKIYPPQGLRVLNFVL